ncbi:MAG: AMIN domain-containing protein [Terriglobales bacterium]
MAGGQAQVTAVEHQATGDRIRVVVHFDRPVRFVEGTAADPYRIFFDLQGTRPADALALRTAVGDSPLRRIRVSQYQPGITRVVLDVDRPAPYSASFLADPPRLVVEISRTAAAAQSRIVAAPAPTPAAPPDPAVTPAAIPAPPATTAPAPTVAVAPSDSRLASRIGAGASGDPSTLLQAAQRGDPKAQYALGTLYASGRGVPRDDAQALKWLKAAAAQGCVPAQLVLGRMYVAGTGAPRDYAEAMRNFRSADTPEAWYQLGLMYQQGLGAVASDAEAVVWWLKAAQRGSAEAQSAIGRLYLNRDPVEAYSWFALAAAAGDKESAAAMNSLAPRLTAQQLLEAQQRALAMAQPRQ